jgi:hypothetical protein
MGEVKKILVPGKTPPATSFKVDDIVINPVDGKLFFKTINNEVKEIAFSGSFITGSVAPDAITNATTSTDKMTFTRGDARQFQVTLFPDGIDGGTF